MTIKQLSRITKPPRIESVKSRLSKFEHMPSKEKERKKINKLKKE